MKKLFLILFLFSLTSCWLFKPVPTPAPLLSHNDSIMGIMVGAIPGTGQVGGGINPSPINTAGILNALRPYFNTLLDSAFNVQIKINQLTITGTTP